MMSLQVHDRVQVEGYNEHFRVVHVDAFQESVDVACIERVGFLTQVPLSLVRPVKNPQAH